MMLKMETFNQIKMMLNTFNRSKGERQRETEQKREKREKKGFFFHYQFNNRINVNTTTHHSPYRRGRLLLSMRSMCCIHIHLLVFTSFLRVSVLALQYTSSLDTRIDQ